VREEEKTYLWPKRHQQCLLGPIFIFSSPFHPFGPCISVPCPLVVLLPLTSLFPVPLSPILSLSLHPLCPCSLFPVPLSLVSSTHNPPCKQWLTGLGVGARSFFVVVLWSWSHPCHSLHPIGHLMKVAYFISMTKFMSLMLMIFTLKSYNTSMITSSPDILDKTKPWT